MMSEWEILKTVLKEEFSFILNNKILMSVLLVVCIIVGTMVARG